MLKKNARQKADLKKAHDEMVWLALLILLFLVPFAVICLYAGIYNYNINKSIINDNLICYSGTASDIMVAPSRTGVTNSWRVNTYSIVLNNNEVVTFHSSPFYEYGMSPKDIQIGREYDWYYIEGFDDGYRPVVSIADEGFDEAQFDCVSRFVKRQAWIPLCAGGFFVLLSVADFCVLIQSIVVGSGFESRKQREKRIAEEKRKAERRTKYLEERERLREAKQKKH